MAPCYGAWLKVRPSTQSPRDAYRSVTLLQIVHNIITRKCHVLFCLLLSAPIASGQNAEPLKRQPPAGLSPEYVNVGAVTQDLKGPVKKLRGAASLETTEMRLQADEIDYDEEKAYAEARGNVRYDNYVSGEHLEADKVEYQIDAETGRYYNVRGSSPAKLEARPGVLTTTSPFSFQGKWAERIENRYILHEGFITNCKLPRPWWILTGNTFDVLPGKRAIAKNSTFRLKRIPLFYTPVFYKSLERVPRKSGFLTPNLTNSNRRGITLGAGYYWAINRSYDLMYRSQWFSKRGFGHNVDFRGKPARNTEFNYLLYGVNDKGFLNPDGTRRPAEGGFLSTLTGRSELKYGFRASGVFNYLSSFQFRQAFTDSFFEAIYSEVNSLGHLSKYWSTFAFNVAASRVETFQWPTAASFPYDPGDSNKLSLRKLPSFEFNSRDLEINRRVLPLWVSWNTSYSLLRRRERAFVSDSFVGRADAEPRVMTALRWKDFHLIPAFSIRETSWSSGFGENGQLSGQSILRSSREFSTELVMPTISKIFEHPPKILGAKLKHVIEPRASFRYVGGASDDFRRLIRFDETELVSDTRELEVSLTNRLFSKSEGGGVVELLSWELTQRRYFDPDFGGVLRDGYRNVLLSSASVSGYAFIDRPRNYSPVISSLRGNLAGIGVEWRADYDPLRQKVVNSSFSGSGRILTDYFVTVGHNLVSSVPVTSDRINLQGLSPRTNQLFTVVGYGQENRRGISAGMLLVYDYTQQVMLYNQTQITYNTDCCGWSVQFRRLGLSNRNENQFRLAFNVANIGSFGTLRRQERMF